MRYSCCIAFAWLCSRLDHVTAGATGWLVPADSTTTNINSCGGNTTFEWIFYSPGPYSTVKIVKSNDVSVMDIAINGIASYIDPALQLELYCPDFQQGTDGIYCSTVRMTNITEDKFYSCDVLFPLTHTGGFLPQRSYNMTICDSCPPLSSVMVKTIDNKEYAAQKGKAIVIPVSQLKERIDIQVTTPETNCEQVKAYVYLGETPIGSCNSTTLTTCNIGINTLSQTIENNLTVELKFAGWPVPTVQIKFVIKGSAPKALWQCLAALVEGIVSIVFNVIVIIICILIIRGKLRDSLVQEIPTNTGETENINGTANQKSIKWVKLKPMVPFIVIIVVMAILFILGMVFFALCADKKNDLAATVVGGIGIASFLVAVVLLMFVFIKRTPSCSEKSMDSDNTRSPSPVTVSNVAVTTSSPHSLSAKPSSQQNTPRHDGRTVTPPLRLPGITSKTVESSRGRPLQPLSSHGITNAVSPDKNPENGEHDNKKKKKKKKKKKQRGESKDDDNDGDVY